MARQEIRIDGETFQPKRMGLVERLMTEVALSITRAAAASRYSDPDLRDSIVDTIETEAYYGSEAAQAVNAFFTRGPSYRR